jgi:hypothetical protein
LHRSRVELESQEPLASGCDDLPILWRCLAARTGQQCKLCVIVDVIMTVTVDVDNHQVISLARSMMAVRGARKSRRGVRAVECPVLGRWVVVSESWGCDQVCFAVVVEGPVLGYGGVEGCLTYGYLHTHTYVVEEDPCR